MLDIDKVRKGRNQIFENFGPYSSGSVIRWFGNPKKINNIGGCWTRKNEL